MNDALFQKLLEYIRADITKQDTFMGDSISAHSKLQITLGFLATGESYRSLMYSRRVHESTISRFIPEVCEAIYRNLKEQYLTVPRDPETWQKIATEFFEMWQFPNCVRALDGKHITFRPPLFEGSYYYNYKGQHSIVLLAMADAKYKFSNVNVGVNGRLSDGGVFRESLLASCLAENIKFSTTM